MRAVFENIPVGVSDVVHARFQKETVVDVNVVQISPSEMVGVKAVWQDDEDSVIGWYYPHEIVMVTTCVP